MDYARAIRVATLVAVCVAVAQGGTAPAAETPTPSQTAAKIDGFLESYWSANRIQPAARTDDATFLRRLTLDLAGRIPTVRELDLFLSDTSDDKRGKAIKRLIGGPEFPLHLGNVLDEMVQGQYAGDAEFVDYLRRSIRDGKSWSEVFRELMLGPWDTDAVKAGEGVRCPGGGHGAGVFRSGYFLCQVPRSPASRRLEAGTFLRDGRLLQSHDRRQGEDR
jgi:hypothetical protein